MDILLLAVFGACACAMGAGAWFVDRRLKAAGNLVMRSESRLAELRRIEQGRLELADVPALAEGTVEGGTRVVQAVHHGIASIPFAILEAIPPTRAATRVVHVTHDVISNTVYGSISAVNRGIGWLLKRVGAPPRRDRRSGLGRD